jgi:hypothetical protein
MSEDRTEREIHYFRGLTAGYTDAIRVSDAKANIAVLFVAFMMSPILVTHDKYPPFLPLPVVLLPFLVVYFLLLVALFPRYPRRGRQGFLIARDLSPDQFVFTDDPAAELAQLRLRAAILSGILYQKTLCLRISFAVSMVTIVAAAILLAYFDL